MQNQPISEEKERERQSQNIQLSLEKQTVSMELLDVTEVGSFAYLFMFNNNTQRSEYAEGKGKKGRREYAVHACVQVDNQGKHRRAVSCHTAEMRERRQCTNTEDRRDWMLKDMVVNGATRQYQGHGKTFSGNSKQQAQASKACTKKEVKPTGNSEPKSALKSLLSTSSKILAVPESMPICSIML